MILKKVQMLDLQDYKRNAFQLRKEVEEARSRQTLRKLRAAIVEDQPKGFFHIDNNFIKGYKMSKEIRTNNGEWFWITIEVSDNGEVELRSSLSIIGGSQFFDNAERAAEFLLENVDI